MTTVTATATRPLDELEAEHARFTAEQNSPQLRTNAKRRHELGLEIADLAVQIQDARAAAVRVQVAALEAEREPLATRRSENHAEVQAAGQAIPALEAEQRRQMEAAQERFRLANLEHANTVALISDLDLRASRKRRELKAIMEGEYYNADNT